LKRLVKLYQNHRRNLASLLFIPAYNGAMHSIYFHRLKNIYLDIPAQRAELLSFLNNSVEETHAKDEFSPRNSKFFEKKNINIFANTTLGHNPNLLPLTLAPP
jgi:hypothetical protein